MTQVTIKRGYRNGREAFLNGKSSGTYWTYWFEFEGDTYIGETYYRFSVKRKAKKALKAARKEREVSNDSKEETLEL